MKKSVILALVLTLLAASSCDFIRTLAGRPTASQLEEKRMRIEREEEARHQARLEVASEPGRGSRFAVILPEFRCRARPEDALQEDVAQDDDDDRRSAAARGLCCVSLPKKSGALRRRTYNGRFFALWDAMTQWISP